MLGVLPVFALSLLIRLPGSHYVHYALKPVCKRSLLNTHTVQYGLLYETATLWNSLGSCLALIYSTIILAVHLICWIYVLRGVSNINFANVALMLAFSTFFGVFWSIHVPSGILGHGYSLNWRYIRCLYGSYIRYRVTSCYFLGSLL